MLPTHVRTGTSTDLRLDDPDEEESVLVARAKLGDARAFALLYRRYVARVYAFAARRLIDRAASEEATQEVFTRALAGLGRCRADEAFAGWLFGTARNVVTEHRRAAGRDAALGTAVPERTDTDPTPEEHAVRTEAAAELRAARAVYERALELRDLLRRLFSSSPPPAAPRSRKTSPSFSVSTRKPSPKPCWSSATAASPGIGRPIPATRRPCSGWWSIPPSPCSRQTIWIG